MKITIEEMLSPESAQSGHAYALSVEGVTSSGDALEFIRIASLVLREEIKPKLISDFAK